MLVPKLRFKEFTGEWKESELKKISSELIYGMNCSATDFDGTNKYIRITDINEETSLYNNSNLVPPLGRLENKYLVNENDILFARTGASTGKSYLYNSMNGKLYFAGFLIKAHINTDHNSRFIFEQFKLNKYKNWIKLMSMRSGQPGINANEYGSYVLSITSKNEENKIAETLEFLNKKIELQSKKIEALKIYKKGIIHSLEKNKKEWDKYKIKDIFNITRGIVIPKNILSVKCENDYVYPVYSSQTFNNGILGYDKDYSYNGKYLTWTTDGANAGRVFYRNGKFKCTNVCGILYDDNKRFTNELVAELLNYETPKHVSYIGNPKLMNNVMAEIEIALPNIDIQKQVSLLLEMLNKKTSKEITKLTKINQLKKGLMQNMFV